MLPGWAQHRLWAGALQCLGAGACSRLGPLRPGSVRSTWQGQGHVFGVLAFFLIG